MTDQQHPITPPPELVKQWLEDSPEDDEFGIADYIATQAARWGADQQLEQDANWLDTNALYTRNLTVSPSGDALRQVMRPRPPSLKEQALDSWDRLRNEAWCEEIDFDLHFIRRALEALPND